MFLFISVYIKYHICDLLLQLLDELSKELEDLRQYKIEHERQKKIRNPTQTEYNTRLMEMERTIQGLKDVSFCPFLSGAHSYKRIEIMIKINCKSNNNNNNNNDNNSNNDNNNNK